VASFDDRSTMKTQGRLWMLAAVQGILIAWAANAMAAKVYVANEDGGTVSVLDGTTFKALANVRVGKLPHNVQVAPGGRFAWVTNNGAANEAETAGGHDGAAGHGASAPGEVWVIDTATDSVVAKIPVGLHPAHVVLTPDARHAYVTNGGDDTVSVVDTTARRVVATIGVDKYPHGIRISPDGRQAYVANLKGGTVSVIDIGSRKELARIRVGMGPAQVGFTPDGRLAFASLSQENAVAVIDPVHRKLIARVKVGSIPIQVHATPDSRMLLVANQGSRSKPGKTVSMIQLDGFKVVKSVETGRGAHGVAIDAAGRYAFVTNIYADSVSVIDLKDQKVVANVRVGKGPNGISVTP
jgi:YVTN family beta-propeller protein